MSVRFAHISDSHIGPERAFRLYDSTPAPLLERLVERLNQHRHELDFVIHTGDVTDDADPRSVRLASQILGRLEVPLYLVRGNHDNSTEMRRSFAWPPPSAERLAGDEYAYTFRCGAQRFLVLDAVAPQELDPQGRLSPSQLQAVDDGLATWPEPLTLFIHFPAVALDCRWVDEQMLIVNGMELHQRLAAQASRIRGVCFGHVHRGVQVLRDGVVYSSVASTFCQFQNWPSHQRMHADLIDAAFYNLVTLTDTQLTVRQMWA